MRVRTNIDFKNIKIDKNLYIGNSAYYGFICPVCKETKVLGMGWVKYYFRKIQVCSWNCKCKLSKNKELQKEIYKERKKKFIKESANE